MPLPAATGAIRGSGSTARTCAPNSAKGRRGAGPGSNVQGPDAVAVFAGPQAIAALMPYVDEVRLWVYPVLLGRALPGFRGHTGRLRLVETWPFAASGAVQLRYRPV
jgi:hypothetical protein